MTSSSIEASSAVKRGLRPLRSLAGPIRSSLATCLRNPAITTAQPLAALLADWGRDDLVPDTLAGQVRKAVSRTPPTYQLRSHTP